MTRKNEVIEREYFDHVARLVLAHRGVQEIADILGVSRATVTRILKNPEFEAHLATLKRDIYSSIDALLYDERADMMQRINAAAPRALSRLFDLVENARSEHVRHQAARDVLGMAGIAPVERRVEASVQLNDFTPEQKDMLTQAISAALGSGQVTIDAGAAEVTDITAADPSSSSALPPPPQPQQTSGGAHDHDVTSRPACPPGSAPSCPCDEP